MKFKSWWILVLIVLSLWLGIWYNVNNWYEDGVREEVAGEVVDKVYRTDSTYRFKLKIQNETNETWIAVNGNTYDQYRIGDNISGEYPVLYTDFQRRASLIWWATTWLGFLGWLICTLILSSIFVSEIDIEVRNTIRKG